MPFADILTYWTIFKKRSWLVILLVLVTISTILFQQHSQEPTFKVSVLLQISAPSRSEVSLFEGYRTSYARDEIPFIQGNLLTIVKSTATANQVISELGIKGKITAQEITSSIETEEIATSDFTRILFYAHDPQLAADILNKLSAVALRRYGELAAKSAIKSREFIAAELETVRQQVSQSEDALIKFQIENRIGILDSMIVDQQILLRNLRLERDIIWAANDLEHADNYDRLIALREAELQDLVRLTGEYNILQTTVKQSRETYNFLLEKEAEAKLVENETLGVGFIQIFGNAAPPNKPISPYNLKLILLGGGLALLLGIIIVLGWEFIISINKTRQGQTFQDNLVDLGSGVYNQPYFLQRMNAEMSRARRQQYPLSIVALNISTRDVLNAHSPQAQADILGQFAAFLRQYLREEDLLAYFGNAEFGLLLPDMSGKMAKETMDKLLTRITWTLFDLESSGIKVNLSGLAGIVEYDYSNITNEEMIEHARQALNSAQELGYAQSFLVTAQPLKQDESCL